MRTAACDTPLGSSWHSKQQNAYHLKELVRKGFVPDSCSSGRTAQLCASLLALLADDWTRLRICLAASVADAAKHMSAAVPSRRVVAGIESWSQKKHRSTWLPSADRCLNRPAPSKKLQPAQLLCIQAGHVSWKLASLNSTIGQYTTCISILQMQRAPTQRVPPLLEL